MVTFEYFFEETLGGPELVTQSVIYHWGKLGLLKVLVTGEKPFLFFK